MSRSIIIGHKGEVGGALLQVLSPVHEVYGIDLEGKVEEAAPQAPKVGQRDNFDVAHICLRYSPDFLDIVRGYLDRFQPGIVDVCTTVPPGTTEQIGPHAVHSTTRGQHPHLAAGLRAIPKHISGPKAEALARYYRKAGLVCVTDPNPRTTEWGHLANNVHYGLNLVLADLLYRSARKAGVDFMDYLDYTRTNNEGYRAMGHETKVRPILTPPNGRIGGHCVIMSARMLLETIASDDPLRPLVELVGGYTGEE